MSPKAGKAHLLISGDLFLSLLCHQLPDDTHVRVSCGSVCDGFVCVWGGLSVCVCVPCGVAEVKGS